MREIKFRTYVRFLREMHEVREMILDKGAVMIDAYQYGLDKDDAPVMQFTGLADKNGVEIYEGDIVNWQAGCVKGVNAIIYSDGGFCIDSSFQDDMSIYQSYASEALEIIGNIHQNRELLEQNDE